MPPRLTISGEYPDDWKAIADAVKEHAGRRCVRCGTPHRPDIGRCLTVHHFDGNKSNSAAWNLMALCQACHLSVQSRVNPHTPYMFTPTPWSMPYIAGFYVAGHGSPMPGFSVEQWQRVYFENAAQVQNAGRWPVWAPTPREQRGEREVYNERAENYYAAWLLQMEAAK